MESISNIVYADSIHDCYRCEPVGHDFDPKIFNELRLTGARRASIHNTYVLNTYDSSTPIVSARVCGTDRGARWPLHTSVKHAMRKLEQLLTPSTQPPTSTHKSNTCGHSHRSWRAPQHLEPRKSEIHWATASGASGAKVLGFVPRLSLVDQLWTCSASHDVARHAAHPKQIKGPCERRCARE